MYDLLNYQIDEEDGDYKNPRTENLEDTFDGLTIQGFRDLFYFNKYLRSLKFRTNCYYQDGRFILNGVAIGNNKLLNAIEKSIYELMDVAFYDRKRIRYDKYPLTYENLARFEEYCNILISEDINLFRRYLVQRDFLLFLVACKTLRIQNFTALKINIKDLRDSGLKLVLKTAES